MDDAPMARLLRPVDMRAVSQREGRDAGVLPAAAGTADAIDGTVMLLAAPGDRILRSDPEDITVLAAAAENRAVIGRLLDPACPRHLAG